MGTTESLVNQDAVAKLKELAKEIDICMFCTNLTVAPFSTRPMSVREVDAEGNIWFISSAASNKNMAIKEDEHVQLLFAQPSSAHFLDVYGRASVYTDKATIEDKWQPMAKAWFSEGKDDPDVTIIKVAPSEAYYWDTKNGKMISLLKIAAAAVTGKQMDGGIEGRLNL